MSFRNQHLRHSIFCATILAAYLIAFSSCVNTRKATYFNDLGDSARFASTKLPQSLIQPNDILSISVSSLSPEATVIFNTPNTPSGYGQPSGYLVTDDGIILFPVLGSIKAGGLTKDQLKTSITKSLIDKKLLVDPIVSVRFQNFRVTVLGEVKNPTVIPVLSEKISLLEAIGLAGDLTIDAKRDNVLVIREENGEKTVKRLNLNSIELFTSPYYYLKSNDIVYVEPNKAKVASASNSRQFIPVILSSITLVVVILDRLLR
jgi:polysaccharide export outer membrane protein